MEADCLFCDRNNPERHTILFEDENAYARWDNFPVSQGHLEIVPKRHVSSFFELTKGELLSVYRLLGQAKELVDEKHHPDSYNIGVNDGEAAGQTIPHAHIHLIPRYTGDVPNPRGGVRNVIPGKGDY